MTREAKQHLSHDPVCQDHARCFADLVHWRRDVRRFKPDAISETALDRILVLADLSPSVGNSQPWRTVRVKNSATRTAVRSNFETANAAAAAAYDNDADRRQYLALKLAGFDAAPEHLAVFCDHDANQGRGLGRQTMPEMLDYSCVSYVTTLWYAARAEGLGMGWVSILDPLAITRHLSLPTAWRLIAYLLIGIPEEEHLDPELDRHGWQARTSQASRLFER